jgi:hypothetical protein
MLLTLHVQVMPFQYIFYVGQKFTETKKYTKTFSVFFRRVMICVDVFCNTETAKCSEFSYYYNNLKLHNSFVILIPCILEYVENNQQNALNSILLFYDGSYMFRQNNAIFREQLCVILSHFNVIMVGDKS